MSERKLSGHTQRNIRATNLQVILSIFRRSELLTVRDITEQTGLSKTAVSKILTELLDRGLILQAGKGASTEGGGKRPDLFTLSTKSTFVIAATLLPNLLAVCLYDANLTPVDTLRWRPDMPQTSDDPVLQRVIHELRTACSQQYLPYPQASELLAQMILQLIDRHGLSYSQIAGITVSLVGIVSSETGTQVTTLISKVWPDNLPVKADLEQKLPFSCNIYVDNISRLGGYYLLWEDPKRYQKNVVVLYCDNSVGGAYIRRGHLVHGKRGLVGEYGHITTDYTFKAQCACGKSGCFESIVARERIEERVSRELPNWPESMLHAAPNASRVPIEDLFWAADQGDTFACRQVDLIARQFAIMIYNFQIMYDPDEVIIFAYCTPQNRYLAESIRRQLSYFAGQTEMDLSIRTAGDSLLYASLLDAGAAAFCLDQYYANDALSDLPAPLDSV